MTSFFSELKRRNVFKVAVAYGIVAWLVLQIASLFFPTFGAPDWAMRVFSFIIILGFPIAVILAWAFELTPEGVKPTQAVSVEKSITHLTGRRFDFAIIALLAVALGFVVIDNYVLDDPSVATELPNTQAEENPAPDSVAESPPSVAQQAEKLPNSVAVLPFANLSPDPNNAYFAAGIHDTVLHELSKNNDLNVIARTSMLQYADGLTPISEVARELNVETIMEGTVQYAADQVRITAQLIDPATGAHLWSGNYDRAFADIFAIQSEIAARIAEALEAELLPDAEQNIVTRPTQSEAAYALYLKALAAVPNLAPVSSPDFYFSLNQATVLDPEFALAHATLAFAYARGIGYADSVQLAGSVEAHETLVREHAEAALNIDPNQGLAHAALAMLEGSYFKLVEAEAHWERAISASPNDVEVLDDAAIFYAYMERIDETNRLFDRIADLDPAVKGGAAYYLPWIRGDFLAAAASFRKLVDITPSEWFGLRLVYVFIGRAEAIGGDIEAALEALRRAEQLAPEGAGPASLSKIAYAYHRAGEDEDAKRAFQQYQDIANDEGLPVQAPAVAQVFAYLAIDDTENTLKWLQAVVDNPGPAAGFMEDIFDLINNTVRDPVLDQPEFVEVRNRLASMNQ